jgi:hypothetical protein
MDAGDPVRSQMIELGSQLDRLKDGENRLSTSPSGLSLWAVKKADQITDWIVKDREGTRLRESVHAHRSASRAAGTCTLTICVVRAPGVRECWDVEVPCDVVIIVIVPK